MHLNHVAGENKGKIMLYALSTCIWCQRAKEFLDELGVEYDYVDVDLLEGDEQNQAVEAVKELNPRCSYPTLAINGQCIVGFKQQEIKEALRS